MEFQTDFVRVIKTCIYPNPHIPKTKVLLFPPRHSWDPEARIPPHQPIHMNASKCDISECKC